jgi:hypothetical protein
MNANPIKTLVISILVMMCAICLSVSLWGCKDDPKPRQTEAQKVTKLLTSNGGRWSPAGAAAITADGIDVTQDLFAGFSITFSENTFTTTGTSPVWLRQDTWTFKDETAKVIIRGQDGKAITITSISETQLKLTLQWDQTTYDGGRKRSLAGSYELVLTK